MINNLLIIYDLIFFAITQFETTGSIDKQFYSGSKSEKYNPLLKSILIFKTLTLLLFDSGSCLTFNKRNELNLKKDQ